MLRRWIVLAAVSTLSFCWLSAATAAEAAPSPQLTLATRSITASTPCGAWTFNVRVPVLTGSTAANQAAVAAWGDWMRQDLVASANKDAASCAFLMAQPNEIDGAGSVYAGRYVSVMTRWRADVTGNLKTLTLDLRTGQPVGIDSFVSDTGNVFTWAKCLAFVRIADYLRDSFCPGGDAYQDVSGWRVSTRGVQLYGEGDDSYYYSPTIPWSGVVKAGYASSRKHTTTSVRTTNTNSGVVERSTVTVQGNLVIVTKKASRLMESFTEYGVRGTGKTIVVFPSAWGPGALSVEPMEDAYNDTLTFRSKKSTKAKVFRYVLVGD